jgi:hypothetical protein
LQLRPGWQTGIGEPPSPARNWNWSLLQFFPGWQTGIGEPPSPARNWNWSLLQFFPGWHTGAPSPVSEANRLLSPLYSGAHDCNKKKFASATADCVLLTAKTGFVPAHSEPASISVITMASRRFFTGTFSLVGSTRIQNLVAIDESRLESMADRVSGIGADPSPTRTGEAELMAVAPPTALRAPASIKAAKVAIIVFFIGTTS